MGIIKKNLQGFWVYGEKILYTQHSFKIISSTCNGLCRLSRDDKFSYNDSGARKSHVWTDNEYKDDKTQENGIWAHLPSMQRDSRCTFICYFGYVSHLSAVALRDKVAETNVTHERWCQTKETSQSGVFWKSSPLHPFQNSSFNDSKMCWRQNAKLHRKRYVF